VCVVVYTFFPYFVSPPRIYRSVGKIKKKTKNNEFCGSRMYCDYIEGEENVTSIAGIHSYIYIYIFIAPLLFIGIEKTRVSRKEGGRGRSRTLHVGVYIYIYIMVVLRHRNAIHGITPCNCVIDRFWIDVNETTDKQGEWLGT